MRLTRVTGSAAGQRVSDPVGQVDISPYKKALSALRYEELMLP